MKSGRLFTLIPNKSFSLLSSNSSTSSKIKFIYSSEFSTINYERKLKYCVLHRNLASGKVIHSNIIVNGLKDDSFLAVDLINLYSVCGEILEAELTFGTITDCNVFLLNALIKGYTVNGMHQKALELFYKEKERTQPNSHTFVCVLKVCASLMDIEQGKIIHNLVADSGLASDLFVSNSLIDMYSKCGSLKDSVELFDKMPQRDIISWNSIITGYMHNNEKSEAMSKVRELIKTGQEKPDHVTMINALGICSSLSTLREIHSYCIVNGYISRSEVCNSLISIYGKFGKVEEARSIFSKLNQTNTVAWNAMITVFAQNGYLEDSIQLLEDMKLAGSKQDLITYSTIISSFTQSKRSQKAMTFFKKLVGLGLKLDVVTIASVLPAIADLQDLNSCRIIHAFSYRNGLESDRRIKNAFVSVYSKCSTIRYAKLIFTSITDRDVISWSSIISALTQNGDFNEAIEIFRGMIRSRTEPNPITITSILSSCSGLSNLKLGKELHLWALRCGFAGDTFVGSALIDLYAKCGRIEEARLAFDRVVEKNLVTWNAMIGGYAIHGLGEKAIEIFSQVENPDHISFITVLTACSHGGLVEEGFRIFNRMKFLNLQPSEGHYICMIDMLGRSGQLDRALHLIKTIPTEVISEDIWGSLLMGCKIHKNLQLAMYAGAKILEFYSDNPGYYVLLSNIMADFGRWEQVEMVRKIMTEKGVKKVAGCSWLLVNKQVHSFVAKERQQHPQWKGLSVILRTLNEQVKGIV